MSVQYRRATIDDARIIAETHCASWLTTYPGLIADHVIAERTNVEKRAQGWDTIFQEGNAEVWLAHDDQTPCLGFCSFGALRSKDVETDGQITALYLLQPAQRRGIGRALLAIAIKQMIARNYKSACVEVLKENPAEKFYRAMGGELAYTAHVQEFGVEIVESVYVWKNLEEAMKTHVQTAPRT
jgi:ribosomal protein S18 acetylase RimI-like enzyme